MAGFLYYIPEKNGVTENEISKAGLSALMKGNDMVTRQVMQGPDNNRGCIFYPKYGSGSKPQVGFFPQKTDKQPGQTWHEAGKGLYWIGHEKDKLPGPDDLRRKEIVAGYPVKLGDGNEWEIPTARQFALGSVLPESLILGPEGELVTKALPQFAEISQMADEIWEFIRRSRNIRMTEDEKLDPPEEMTFPDGWKKVERILQQNYIINEWGMSLLKIITTINIPSVFEAFVDYPGLLKMSEQFADADAKKKDAQPLKSSGLSDGKTDFSPTTSPPSQTKKSLPCLSDKET